jgi:hypothetical protein
VGDRGIDTGLNVAWHCAHLIGERDPISEAIASKDVESQKVRVPLRAGVSDAAQQVVQVDVAFRDNRVAFGLNGDSRVFSDPDGEFSLCEATIE